MTPQERDLLTNLVTRLRQSPPQPRDPEAQAIINDLVRDKPDAPYILAQTVLIQDYALHQAQSRIADLEHYLAGNRDNVWENSWVRFPRKKLSPFALQVFEADLLCDKKNPNCNENVGYILEIKIFN